MKSFLKRLWVRLHFFLRVGGNSRPFTKDFGLSLGLPVDRVYIEDFLQRESYAIKGDVLEIAENTYTEKFARSKVNSHILHVQDQVNSEILVGNLETGENIPTEKFDCLLITQTLPFVYNPRAFLENCYKTLKPGGVLLLTTSGISQISRYDMNRWGDYWRFTQLSLRKLATEFFEEQNVIVDTLGNVKAACALLQGYPSYVLTQKELAVKDPDYPVTLTLKAIR